MINVDLKAGDIFTWQNYPYYFKEFKPQRWLLYLGNNTIEAIVYQISTTTQYQHYNQDGDRKNNNYFELPAGMGGLEEKSILDLSLFFERIPELDLNKCKADITKKGSLSQDYINRFVKYLKKDRHIQTIIKKDIYRYLRDSGFKIA
jgi:hypothetical protein